MRKLLTSLFSREIARMTLFKVRVEVNLRAGGQSLLVAGGRRPPLLALDTALTWRERVVAFSSKVLGLAPLEMTLREARTLLENSDSPELRLCVDCRVERAAPPLDERLMWSGEDSAHPGLLEPLSGGDAAECLDPEETVQLYTDGGSRGNPGPAGIGAVLSQRKSGYREELAAHIGTATNNVAEYTALVEGLRLARERGARRVEHLADSELLVRQLEGRYKVKSPELKALFEQAQSLIRVFDRFSTCHVRRELNSQADSLVNRALDEALGIGEKKSGAGE